VFTFLTFDSLSETCRKHSWKADSLHCCFSSCSGLHICFLVGGFCARRSLLLRAADMFKIFGTAKKDVKAPSAASTADSIRKIRETMEMLEKRETFLQKKSENELAEAKRLTREKNKRGALMALKRKKKYDAQVEQTSNTRFRLEEQVMVLENANVNLETVQAMKQGTAALKAVHGALNVDKVDHLMDDVREQMELAEEINQAIAQPISASGDYDEDELNAELEQLEQEELDNQLLEVNKPSAAAAAAAPALPSRPAAAAASASKKPVAADEDAELRELEASMAL